MEVVEIITPEQAVAGFLVDVQPRAARQEELKRLMIFVVDALEMRLPTGEFVKLVETNEALSDVVLLQNPRSVVFVVVEKIETLPFRNDLPGQSGLSHLAWPGEKHELLIEII
jgi:hypothetical protein